MAVLELLMIGFLSVINLKLFSHFLLKIVEGITSGNNKRDLY